MEQQPIIKVYDYDRLIYKSIQLFFFSLPLMSLTIIESGRYAFAPSLFISLLVFLFLALRLFNSPFSYFSIFVIFGFLVVSSVSFLSSLFFSGIEVYNFQKGIVYSELDSFVFFRFVRVFYSCLLIVLILEFFRLKDFSFFIGALKFFLYGYLVGAFFGAWQFFLNFMDISFWSPFGQKSWELSNQVTLGLYRSNGSTSEPSHWAMISTFALAFSLLIYGFNEKKRYLAFALLSMFGILTSFSGTAVVSAIGFLFAVLFALISSKPKVGILVFFISLILVFFISISLIQTPFFENFIEKLSGQGESGSDRMDKLLIGLNAFFDSNFLGVGIGPYQTFNLFATILMSGGILFFTYYLYIVSISFYYTYKKRFNIFIKISVFVIIFSLGFIFNASYGEIVSFLFWLYILLPIYIIRYLPNIGYSVHVVR